MPNQKARENVTSVSGQKYQYDRRTVDFMGRTRPSRNSLKMICARCFFAQLFLSIGGVFAEGQGF
jgi:hypothetical protein